MTTISSYARSPYLINIIHLQWRCYKICHFYLCKTRKVMLWLRIMNCISNWNCHNTLKLRGQFHQNLHCWIANTYINQIKWCIDIKLICSDSSILLYLSNLICWLNGFMKCQVIITKNIIIYYNFIYGITYNTPHQFTWLMLCYDLLWVCNAPFYPH